MAMTYWLPVPVSACMIAARKVPTPESASELTVKLVATGMVDSMARSSRRSSVNRRRT